ncbi:hypothetical protein N0V93_000592 [Gnomoniopsis smithogilvyi]|uniref:Uncharacterized protein n=1 Tax=Gnomoniopsis smithogilvyi TaxID=1191159 RepID=A0A9W8Z232_9PEZI|nr:hypothetical protein N0V93_000592 [Gnomoniopsis smithogilvyi]
MHFYTAFSLLALPAITFGVAVPEINHAQLAGRANSVNSVHLSFVQGSQSYNLMIPADGREYYTDYTMDISLIRSDNYDPFQYCHFKTQGGDVALVSGLAQRTRDFWPINEVAVGPPTPIVSVKCSGFCLAIAEDCTDSQGESTGPCCNGFCAANKCRPYTLTNKS